jgi:hypothetical protein
MVSPVIAMISLLPSQRRCPQAIGKDDCWSLTSNEGSSRHLSRVVGERHPLGLYNVLSAMVVGDTSAGAVDHARQPSVESCSAEVDGARLKESRHIAEL